MDDVEVPFPFVFVPHGLDDFVRELDIPVNITSVSGEVFVVCSDVLGRRIVFGPVGAGSKRKLVCGRWNIAAAARIFVRSPDTSTFLIA